MYRHAVQGNAKLSYTHKPWCCPPQFYGLVESITKIELCGATRNCQVKLTEAIVLNLPPRTKRNIRKVKLV